jgi:thiol-disulfide isomerase/thioredoxin
MLAAAWCGQTLGATGRAAMESCNHENAESHMRVGCILVVLLTPFLIYTGQGQTYRISLDTLSTLDDGDLHVEAFSPNPAKPVKLPPTDMVGERFLKVFYSWDVSDDPDVVIMVRSKPGGDLLYIDKNANNDLTDDGPSVFFPVNQDTLTFDLVSRTDPHQRATLLLSRALHYSKSFQSLSDSTKASYVDKQGNLNPRFVRMMSMATPTSPDFTGKRGTFYFDDRLTLRRGWLVVRGVPHAIGLFDFTNNGLYNDKKDVILVDGHGNGLLKYLDYPNVHKLDEVLTIDTVNFRIRDLDPYGTWVELEETKAAPTNLFVDYLDSAFVASAGKYRVKPQIWDLVATGVDSSAIALKNFRGKYLLLNFWGEWCGPCLKEIPALRHAVSKYADSSVQFLSFVKVMDSPKARRVIADSAMSWPQAFLDKKASDMFPVRAFPTNILILPNGQECILTQTLSDAFFDKFVH